MNPPENRSWAPCSPRNCSPGLHSISRRVIDVDRCPPRPHPWEAGIEMINGGRDIEDEQKKSTDFACEAPPSARACLKKERRGQWHKLSTTPSRRRLQRVDQTLDQRPKRFLPAPRRQAAPYTYKSCSRATLGTYMKEREKMSGGLRRQHGGEQHSRQNNRREGGGGISGGQESGPWQPSKLSIQPTDSLRRLISLEKSWALRAQPSSPTEPRCSW